MKIKSTILLAFCCIAVLTACHSDQKTPQQLKFEKAREIYADAMKVHDEVMAEMSKSNSLITSLKEIKDSLREAGDSLKINAINHAISELQLANKTMFTWMENVQTVPAPKGEKSEIIQRNVVKDTANIIQIQTDQKDKVEALEKQMSSSIKKAQELLK